MPDLFSTNFLMATVANLIRPPRALLQRYFGSEQFDASEEIHFDVILGNRRLAPFVSPIKEGGVVESLGRRTDTFKPAYVKDLRVWDPFRPLKRPIGAQIGSPANPGQAIEQLLAQDLMDQQDMLDRRLEWMAIQALKDGSVTVVGDGYPSVSVDFGRDAALEPAALAGAASWEQATSKPLDDLQDHSDLVLQKSGAPATDVILDVLAWKRFRQHASVQGRLDIRRNAGAEATLGAAVEEGLTFMGTIDGFSIYVYVGWYEASPGVLTPFLDAGRLLQTSPALEGVQAFGAIVDEDAGYQAVRSHTKSYTTPNPSRRFILMQSAPLVVPKRINASLSRVVTV